MEYLVIARDNEMFTLNIIGCFWDKESAERFVSALKDTDYVEKNDVTIYHKN